MNRLKDRREGSQVGMGSAPSGDLMGSAPSGDLMGSAPSGDLMGSAPSGDLTITHFNLTFFSLYNWTLNYFNVYCKRYRIPYNAHLYCTVYMF